MKSMFRRLVFIGFLFLSGNSFANDCETLQILVDFNHVNELKTFLTDRKYLIHECTYTEFNETLAAYCARNGTKEALEVILDLDEKSLFADDGKNTLVDHAINNFRYSEDIIRFLVQKDRRILKRSWNKHGPLGAAFTRGNPSAFEALLAVDRDVVSSPDRRQGSFLFSLVTFKEDLGKVIQYAELFLKHRPDLLNEKTSSGGTPVYVAAARGFTSFLEVAYRRDRDVFNSQIFHYLIQRSFVYPGQQEESIRWILGKDLRPLYVTQDGKYPIHEAVMWGKLSFVKEFLSKDPKQIFLKSSVQETPEDFGYRKKHESREFAEIYQYLIDFRKKLESEKGHSPEKIKEFQEQNKRKLEAELEEGEIVKTYDRDDCVVLRDLFLGSSPEKLQNFLKAKPSAANYCKYHKNKIKAAAYCAERGSKEALEIIINDDRERLKEKTDDLNETFTLLDHAISNSKNSESIIRYLVDQDRDILNRSASNYGYLSRAFFAGNKAAFRLLLQFDKEGIYSKINRDANVLFVLASYKDSPQKVAEFTKLFLEYRPDLLKEQSRSQTPVGKAVLNGSLAFLDVAFQTDASVFTPKGNETPILIQLINDELSLPRRRQEEVARWMVERDPRVLKFSTQTKRYPIHSAIDGQYFSLVKFFLEKDPNQIYLKSNTLGTPEELARAKNYSEIYSYLVSFRQKLEAEKVKLVHPSQQPVEASKKRPAESGSPQEASPKLARVPDEEQELQPQRKLGRKRNIVVTSDEEEPQAQEMPRADDETQVEQDRKPLQISLSRSTGGTYIPNSFKEENHKRIRNPEAASPPQDAVPLNNGIEFKKVGKARIGESYQQIIQENDRLFFTYLSFRREVIPPPHERVTIVLAERGLDLSYPQEKEGGRVIFLIDAEQSHLASRLIGPHEDVCIVQNLKLRMKSEPLSVVERQHITARRIAAFELAHRLRNRAHVAILDDDIKNIDVWEDSFFLDPPSRENTQVNWHHFYQSMLDHLQTSRAAVVGFKSKSRFQKKSADGVSQLGLIDQGPYGDFNSFGKKIFFFDLNQVRSKFQGFGSKYENLFPRDIFLPHEDRYFQVALASLNLKVTHFHPDTVRFQKMKNSPKDAAIKESERRRVVKSEAWMDVNDDSEVFPFQIQAIQRLRSLVVKDLTRSIRERDRQKAANLLHVLPPAVPIEQNFRPAQEVTLPIRAQKIPVRPLRGKKLSLAEGPYRLSDLDPKTDQLEPDHWDNFIYQLTQAEYPRLWKHQNEAIRSFGRMFRDLRPASIPAFLFEMATGTGKTLTMAKIAELGQKELQGNILFISPRLVLKDQLAKNLNGIHYFPVSSKKEDIAAKYAAMNKDFANGKKAAVFCEASFKEFVAAREGDLGDISLIFVDEVHMMSSTTLEILERIGSAKQGAILGFSATPNIPKVKTVFKNRAFLYDTEKAVADNILAPWITRTVTRLGNQEITPDNLNELMPAILKSQRHPQNGKASEKKGIIYLSSTETVADVDHAVHLLNEAGIKALPFHYQMNLKGNEDNETLTRRGQGFPLKVISQADALYSYVNRDTQYFVAIDMLQEGLDIDPVDVIVIADPTPTLLKAIQMRGRALRKSDRNPNKRPLIITLNPKLTEKLMWTGDPKYQEVQQRAAEERWQQRFPVRQ